MFRGDFGSDSLFNTTLKSSDRGPNYSRASKSYNYMGNFPLARVLSAGCLWGFCLIKKSFSFSIKRRDCLQLCF